MSEPEGGGSFLRRAARDAVGLTSSLVEGQVATTARVVVDDLEPYLTEETVPRILEALMPDLVERIVPQVLDGVTAHLAATTVPQVVAGATPPLADDVLPQLLDRLRPYLAAELVPALVDELTPHLVEVAGPRIVDGLTPHLVDVTVPHVLDAVLPKIRAEVVPLLLEDFANDPRVRDLVRQQSLGLVADSFERFRRVLADGDDRVERMIRRVRTGRDVVDVVPDEIPPGRTRSHAGAVTRGVGYAVDLAIVMFLASQGLSALLATVGVLFGTVPDWLAVAATASAVAIAPSYFALSWWLVGVTVGGGIAGFAVCRTDGRRLGFVPAVLRGVGSVFLVFVWVVGMAHSAVDPARRGWLDLLTGSRTPYRLSASVRGTDAAGGVVRAV